MGIRLNTEGCGYICSDNRFELIEKYKQKLIKATNIETAKDEMKVLDSILFRLWQIGWLDKLEKEEQSELKNKELKNREPTLEETVFWIEWIVRKQIMRTISLQKVIEEFLWFSDRWCLAEQLTADILFAGSVGGFNDIPEQLDYIKRFCSE